MPGGSARIKPRVKQCFKQAVEGWVVGGMERGKVEKKKETWEAKVLNKLEMLKVKGCWLLLVGCFR